LPSEQDRIVVHPQVLATIAALTALSIPGVARLRACPWSLLTRWFHRCRVPGVQLRVDGDAVSVDLHVIINAGFGLLEVSRRVQASVARAIVEMTDMQVRQVNMHVDGVRAATYS